MVTPYRPPLSSLNAEASPLEAWFVLAFAAACNALTLGLSGCPLLGLHGCPLSNVLGSALIGLAGVTCRPLSNHLWPESGSLGRNMAAKSCSGSLRDWRLGGKGWVIDPHKLSLHLCSVFSALASWQYTTYRELHLYLFIIFFNKKFFLIFPIKGCLLLITLPPYPQSSSSFS